MIFLKKKPAIIPAPTKTKVFWDLDKHGMTQSMLMEFLACRERARLAYKEGYSTTGTSHALTFGNLFHACLESVYRSLRVGVKHDAFNLKNVISVVLDTYKKEVTEERIWTEDDEAELALCRGYLHCLLPAYMEKNLKKDSRNEWLLVEDEFMNEIDGVIFRGKFDRVCRNVHGEVWIHETKTKHLIDPAIQDRLSFDPQVMIYIMNYRNQYKEMPKGFVYDMIQRPRLRKGKDESLQHFIERVRKDVDDTYFQRIRMRVTEQDLENWITNDFQHMIKEFTDWARGKTANFRNPASCETRYGQCKFIRVCGLGDYTGLHQRPKVFPELENAVKVTV